MKNFSPYVVLLFVVLAIGCGDNLSTPTPVTPLSPPTGLKAFSAGQSSISFQWTGTSDSTVQGYIAQVGSRRDTFSRASFVYVANGLPPGEVVFSVSSLRTDGLQSSAATIRWAPAARFDSAYTLYESNTLVSVRPEGFHVGTTGTNPLPMIINPLDPAVQQLMDFYVYGGSQQIQQPLAMWSAHHSVGTFNHTLFSTQTDVSPTLDFPLAAFPAENTFTKDTITIADNTIYYVKVVGDPQQFNYARIHVRFRVGSAFPDRIIEVRVSLQRVSGLLYASDTLDDSMINLKNSMLFSFINRTHS
jgi:hypothetical protein